MESLVPASSAASRSVPFITLTSWVRAAVRCKIDIQKIFRDLGIPPDLMHLETAMVDEEQLVALMNACVNATRQGSSAQHFPFVLGDSFVFDYLPDVGTFIETAPTLRAATRVFEWLPRLVSPMMRARLVQSGAVAHVVLVNQFGFEAPWLIESWMASIVKFGRLLVRGHADFTQLRFHYAAPVWRQAYEDFFDIPVCFEQPHDALEFKAVLLDQPRLGAFRALHEQARARIEQRVTETGAATDPVSLVEQVLSRKQDLLSRGLAVTAQALKLHPRTLQRRLAARGERYADIRARVRYRLALQALDSGAADLDELAEQLGFSDRRSFTRAFCSWSGMTPAAYRSRRPEEDHEHE